MEQTETATVQKNELSDKELCEACGVSRQATRNWRMDGLPYKKRGRNLVYDIDATRKWMRERIVHIILSEKRNALLQRLEVQVDSLVRGPKAGIQDTIRNILDKVETIEDRPAEETMDVVRDAILRSQQFVFANYAEGLIIEFANDVQSVFSGYLFIPEGMQDNLSPDAIYIAEKVIKTLYPDSLTLKD